MGDGEGLAASQWGLLGGSLGGDAVVGQPGAKRRMGGGAGWAARHLEGLIAVLWGLLPEVSTVWH